MDQATMGSLVQENASLKEHDALSNPKCDDLQCLLIAVMESFDQLGIGIVILHEDGGLLCTNRIGQIIVEDLSRARPAVHLSRALQVTRRVETESPTEEGLGIGPRMVHVLSSQASPSEISVRILLLTQPLQCAISHSALDEIFGLTLTESKLANLLMSGMSLADCCEELGITGNTAAYHMKNLFRKTGTCRQNQLLSTLFRSIGISGATRGSRNSLSDSKLWEACERKDDLRSIYSAVSLLRIPKIRENPPEWT
jgi:DNA-binding CsgD family transcriptional regulator